MNAGNVAAFACGRPHPQLGDGVPCLRSRFHGGDHRGDMGGTLKTWTDPTLEQTRLEAAPDTWGLDETTEQWTTPPRTRVDPWAILPWLLVAVVATGWPFILVALARWAL